MKTLQTYLFVALFLLGLILITGCNRIETPTSPEGTLTNTDNPLLQKSDADDDGEPVPIPGGIQIPGGPLIHIFLPGPVDLDPTFFQGVNIEPNVITDFKGFVAMAYLAGQAMDAEGNVYDMFHDIRVYQGRYIDEDGRLSRGTFCLI